MADEMDNVSLVNLAGGAAVEAFDHELQKVIKNIIDPNTKAEAMRSITLKVNIRPSADRELGHVEVSCDSKKVGGKPVVTRFFMGMSKGQAVAVENDPKQSDLFKNEEPTKLTSIGGGKED